MAEFVEGECKVGHEDTDGGKNNIWVYYRILPVF